MVIATFFNNFLAGSGLSAAHIIHETMTKIKHTTNIIDMMIFVNIHIIYGKAFNSSSPVSSHIQFQMIGKFVLSLIQLQPPHSSHEGTSS